MSDGLFTGKEVFSPVTPEGRRTWIWALPILGFIFVIGGQLSALVPAIESGWIQEENVEAYPQILWMLIGAFGAIALLNLLWVRFFERRDLASIGLGLSRRTWFYYLRGLGLGLLFAAVIVYGIRGLGGYELETMAGFGLGDLFPVAILMIGFMIQSGAEEILFRGWLMSRLSERHGILVGVLGNSLAFTLLHLLGIDFTTIGWFAFTIFFLMTMLFSIFLSLLAIKEKSIWGACAWHAGWNWFFITGFGLPTTGIALDIQPILVDLKIADGAPSWLTGGSAGPEDSIVTLIILAAGCLLVARSRFFVSRQEASC